MRVFRNSKCPFAINWASLLRKFGEVRVIWNLAMNKHCISFRNWCIKSILYNKQYMDVIFLVLTYDRGCNNIIQSVLIVHRIVLLGALSIWVMAKIIYREWMIFALIPSAYLVSRWIKSPIFAVPTSMCLFSFVFAYCSINLFAATITSLYLKPHDDILLWMLR